MLLKDFVSPVHRRWRNRLDRFGPVVDHRWINASNVDVDRFKYGYDRNGNRTYKENGVNASLSEVYTNDNLNQLASYKLGTLNTGKSDVTGTPTHAQSWDYDAVGNLGNLRIFNPKFFKYETNENWQYYDRYFYNLFGAEGLGHAAVSITICDQKFYFDDGWLGYVFRPSDIPFLSLPLKP